MKIAYFDCFSGIAGDMALGALIDAGASLSLIREGLSSLKEIKDQWNIEIQSVWKGKGLIAAKKVEVESVFNHTPVSPPVSSAKPGLEQERIFYGHDHTHAHNHNNYIHQNEGGIISETQYYHEHAHDHEHTHVHKHKTHNRNLAQIKRMIASSSLPDWVKQKSIEIFTVLAKAEAKTHGATIDSVHFHEVGAIDSIIDTIGTVLALHILGIERIYASPLPLGEGYVDTAHGILPVPAPATMRILENVPVCPAPNNAKGELVTPTGASILKALCTSFGHPPQFVPTSSGFGAGKKDFNDHPNVLRVVIGTSSEPCMKDRNKEIHTESSNSITKPLSQKVILLETNIDDMTAELCGYVMEELLERGALDVWYSSIYMKKNRPAIMLSVLTTVSAKEIMMEIIFKQTTTIGIRINEIDRCSLYRRTLDVTIPDLGKASIKTSYLEGKVINVSPEYEDCRKVAKERSIPLKEVIRRFNQAAQDNFESC